MKQFTRGAKEFDWDFRVATSSSEKLRRPLSLVSKCVSVSDDPECPTPVRMRIDIDPALGKSDGGVEMECTLVAKALKRWNGQHEGWIVARSVA